MNKKLKRKQALIMAEPYRTPFNSEVAKVSGDVIEDSVGGIKYATSFNGATKIEDANANKIKIKDGTYYIGKSVNLIKFDDKEGTTQDGVTFSIKDGVITFSATPAEKVRNVTFHFNAIGINVDDTYSIALFNQFTSPIGFFVQDKSNSGDANQYLGINENIATTWTVNAGTQYEAIVFYLDANKTYTNEVIKPILVSGSTIPTKYYSGSYGIKIEVADGVMTCNGILASDSEQNWWYNFELPISSGIYSANMFLRSPNINVYLSHGLYDWSNSYQIAVKEASTTPLSNINVKTDCTYIFFSFDKEHDYDNLVLKPMLVEGSTAPTSFEPYFKNLFEFDDQDLEFGGVKINIKNGIFTFNGTANGTHQILYIELANNPVGIYSWNNFGSGKLIFIVGYIGVYLDNESQTFNFSKDNTHGFSWSIKDGEIYDNYVIKPMLVKSSIIPTQFIPFVNPYFVSLGQNGSVQYNGLEPREINLKGNVISKINNQSSDKLSNYALTKNTAIVDLGDLEWTNVTAQSGYRLFSISLQNKIKSPGNADIKANILCTRYENETANNNYNLIKSITVDQDGAVIIYDPDYNTSDKLEAFKKAIKGTLLMYQVKNPTTINTTSFKTFKEDTNATISDDNFTSSSNAITETFKPTRSYDFKVNGFSNVVKPSNLLNIPDKANTTTNGVTYSIKDGVITLNGTTTGTFSLRLENIVKVEENQTYYFYQKTENTTTTFSLVSNTSDYAAEPTFFQYNNKSKIMTKTGYLTAHLYITNTNTTFTNAKFYLMLVEGNIAPTTFEPYFGPYIESFADKRNLLALPNIEGVTIGGVTYSIKNGIFTLNGTSSKSHNININLKNPINSGTYSFNAFTTAGSRADIYANAPLVPLANIGAPTSTKSNISLTSATQLVVWFPKDEKYYNRTFKPMLVEGVTIPTQFLPYQDKYSAFLNVKGKNLLALPDTEETTIDGITYSIKDGVITFSGTPTKTLNLWIPLNNSIQKNKTYYKKVFYSNTQLNEGNLWLCKKLDNYKDRFQMYYGTIDTTYDITYLMIFIEANKTYTNETYKPMLVEGDTAPTEYEPYYSFTKEVLIKQPLRKFDYLTYDGVYRQTNEITLDGTNNIYVDDKGKIFLLKIPNADSVGKNWLVNVASEIMVTTSNLPLLPYYNISNDNQMGIGTNQGNIILKLDDSTDNSLNNWTVEKVNNYFKQNPITITYKTADQTFEATSLTRLLFKNDYNKITPYDSINNNAIVEYLEYYKNKGD